MSNIPKFIEHLILVSIFPLLVSLAPLLFDNDAQASDAGASAGSANEEADLADRVYHPVEDAYIRAGSYSDVNFGDSDVLHATRGLRMGFLKFDFSDYEGSHVERATLRLYAEGRSTGFPYHKLNLYGITGEPWSESEITWDHSPRLGGQWLDVLDAFDSQGWYEIDVTDYVNRHMADREVSFRIENDTTARSRPTMFFSSGTAERHQPELVLLASDSHDAAPSIVEGEDGYDLWLRYQAVSDPGLLDEYRTHITEVVVEGDTLVSESIKDELDKGLSGLLGQIVPDSGNVSRDGAVVVGSPDTSPLISSLGWDAELEKLGDEGFIIRSATLSGHNVTVIAGGSDRGALYGTFRFLKRLQVQHTIADLDVSDRPANTLRMLNHWDNYDSDVEFWSGNGTIERGYAGTTLWQWHELPETVSPRYTDYARANASIGINGTAINSVNATDHFIRTENLPKVAALADVFRGYGIRTYLSLRFDSPMTLGGLDTADPLDPAVIQWWEDKVEEIYSQIPDFGGVLVKGDSEGEPGPLQYDRSHAEGANMLARALKPHGGVVVWRAFVYGVSGLSSDRYKQAYELFAPMDGDFDGNVIIQSKNGPFDFQVREPVAPLFGGMPHTNTGIELQLAQEYTGHSTHTAWLVPQWTEILDFDTHAHGEGSTVNRIVDGSLFDYEHSLFAGVANTGLDRNWTRDHLAQANWYGFGRLAWNPGASSEEIADEWVKMTYGNDSNVVTSIASILKNSWEIYESYTSPLGLGIVTDTATHFKPYVSTRKRFHRAGSSGVGYDRTRTGSGYVDQYHAPVTEDYNDLDTVPEELLLQLHHVPYTHELSSGKTVIQHLYDEYFDGVSGVREMIDEWESLEGAIDDARYAAVRSNMRRQLSEALVWRNVSNRYFHGKSGISDEQGRDDSFKRPTASVETSTVLAGGEIAKVRSSKPGMIYVLPANRANAGERERQDNLDLAADGMTGVSTFVEERDVNTSMAAPTRPGTYKAYSVDEYGNVSDPSEGTITVTDSRSALERIEINGEPLEDYHPDQAEYEVRVPIGTSDVPIVRATSLDSGASVNIAQADSIPGTTSIEVNAADGSAETYVISFNLETAIDPHEDAYVRGGAHADRNYANEGELHVKLDADESLTRMAFLKFDLSSYDSDEEVDQVVLRLNAVRNGSFSRKTIHVYGISAEEWHQDDVTWNNAPRAGGALAGSIEIGADLGWYEIDVTDYVIDQGLDQAIAFRVESQTEHTEGHVFFSSRNAAQDQPELVLILNGDNVKSASGMDTLAE